MRILAFDLGSRTGWSVVEVSGESYRVLGHGFEDLVVGSSSTQRSQTIKKAAGRAGHDVRAYDPRPASFRRLIAKLARDYEPTTAAFEDVLFSHSTYQTQMWGALRGTLWAELGDSVKWVAFNTGEVKKFATGRGDSQKEHMMAAAWKMGFQVTDDNEADAIWIGMLAAERSIDPAADKVFRLTA